MQANFDSNGSYKGLPMPRDYYTQFSNDIYFKEWGGRAKFWGSIGLAVDGYRGLFWSGSYTYKNSRGLTQSIFDTKYGKGYSGDNLGNISKYSKNARGSIYLTKSLSFGSRSLFAVGITIDGIQTIRAYNTNDPRRHQIFAKTTINTAFAAYGFVPAVGWVVSGSYFLIDNTIGWGNALNTYSEIDKNHRRLTGYGMNQGIYKIY